MRVAREWPVIDRHQELQADVTAVAIPSRCSAPSPPLGKVFPRFPWLYTCLTPAIHLRSSSLPSVLCFIFYPVRNLRVLLAPGSPTPYLPAIHPVCLSAAWNPSLPVHLLLFPTALILTSINHWFNSTSVVSPWVPPVRS